jgi:hypothetical protein
MALRTADYMAAEWWIVPLSAPTVPGISFSLNASSNGRVRVFDIRCNRFDAAAGDVKDAQTNVQFVRRNFSERQFVHPPCLGNAQVLQLTSPFGQEYNVFSLIGRMPVADNDTTFDKSAKSRHYSWRGYPRALGNLGLSESVLYPEHPKRIPLAKGYAVRGDPPAKLLLKEPVNVADHVAEASLRGKSVHDKFH